MPIDFSDFLNEDKKKVLNPRDIFFTLNRAASFSFPRDIQTEVMNRWFEDRDKPDNVIKLNVGSGKTLVGLLLLQSAINEGKGPALYVTPDKQLSLQVTQEATALGLEITDDPRDPAYAAAEKICIINVYRLFNGRSIFGVGANKINIGTVIIDDAHACISTIAEQFRIALPNTSAPYKKILTALAEDLRAYSEARFLEINEGDPRTYMEVPFWSWDARHTEVLKVLHEHREDNELKFTYPLIKEILRQCRCVISGQNLEIEPYFPATDLIQSFRRAKRRIYMTATLADDSVIVTHFGADPKNLGKPVVPSSSQSMGERMILMPQELNPELDVADIKSLLVDLAQDKNVVVIVPSETAANVWKDVATEVLIGDQVAEGVEKLRKGQVGLTVLVNRYDGIDLPGNACRVLAIVGLPEVNSLSERVDSEVLSGAAVNLRRQIERIEQGMGRGVRSNDDYCVVLLLGAKLTGRLRSPEGQAMLTPATKAQLDLTRKIAKKMEVPTLDDIKNVILQCLNRDADWIKISKMILLNLKPDDELKLDASKLALREAFDSARANQHGKAAAILDPAIDAASDGQVKAWLISKKAAFQHALDAGGAQKTLAAAYAIEPAVLRPLHGTVYKKLTPSARKQVAALMENHQGRFVDGTTMKLFADGLCNDLQFLPDTSDKFEAAIADLAWFLGIENQRPEKIFKEGPDNLWALSNGTFLIIECKNGVVAGTGISKHDAGQLGQSADWFAAKYPASPYITVMIHPERTLGQGASPLAGMRVIEMNCLERLRKNVRAFAKQLTEPDTAANISEIAKRLTQFNLNADALVAAFSVQVKLK